MSQARENRVRKHLASTMREYFHVQEEVSGSWPVDGRSLRLDLLLRPRSKARDLGFDVDAFGIEVKDPESKESVKKLLDCVIQAYAYTLCEFDGYRPSFVLVYPDVEKFFEYDWNNKYNGVESERPTEREIKIVKRLMQRGNVGELQIIEDQFQINFGQSRFFDTKRGRSKIKGLGKKRQVGSVKY